MPIIKGICELCGGKLEEASRRDVGGTLYVILKCKKCNHVVARSSIA